MTDAVIVEDVSKRYRLGENQHGMLRDAIMGLLRRSRGRGGNGAEVWALRDVGFRIAQGEVVGIIGRNGAGKSTLLKVLARITQPTTGSVRVGGRIASLLEVGTGFHEE